MHSLLLNVGEIDSGRSYPYQLLLWGIVILVAAWLLGLLAVRLIRLIWTRRYQDDANKEISSRSAGSASVPDAWQEAGRRMEPKPPQPPDEPGFPHSSGER